MSYDVLFSIEAAPTLEPTGWRTNKRQRTLTHRHWHRLTQFHIFGIKRKKWATGRPTTWKWFWLYDHFLLSFYSLASVFWHRRLCVPTIIIITAATIIIIWIYPYNHYLRAQVKTPPSCLCFIRPIGGIFPGFDCSVQTLGKIKQPNSSKAKAPPFHLRRKRSCSSDRNAVDTAPVINF